MRSPVVLVIDDSPTILRVVQVVLARLGIEVHTAADGDEGLAEAQRLRPDLVLLDFVMPKRNGYQVCRALSESPTTASIPVILMSARAEQVGERIVKVMGVVDYITKPFAPEALQAVVTHALDRARGDAPTPLETPASSAPLDARSLLHGASATFDDDGDPTGEVAALDGTMPGPGSAETTPGAVPKLSAPDEGPFARSKSGRVVLPGPDVDKTVERRKLAALREALLRAASEDELVIGEQTLRLRERLTDGVLERALATLPPPEHGARSVDEGDGQEILSGSLRPVPITGVLHLIAEQRQSGVLSVTRGAERVDLCFRGGRLDFASAEGLPDEFLLGRYLVDRGAISRQDIELFFKSRGPTSRLSGEQLVKLSYITAEDLKAALERQTAERLFEVLRWREGRFSLRTTADLGARANHAALGLPLEELLLEGFRRIDEWHLIEQEIDDFDLVYLRDDEAPTEAARVHLTRDEVAVLELCNARNSVRDIVRQSRMGTFEVGKLLYRLRAVRLIRRRVQAVAV